MCRTVPCRAAAVAMDVLVARLSCGRRFREGSVSTLIRGLSCLAPTSVRH